MNSDAALKYWRERAEAAEAERARLEARLQEILDLLREARVELANVPMGHGFTADLRRAKLEQRIIVTLEGADVEAARQPPQET